MGKHAIVVVGPAGSGKSTFCKTLYEHYGVKRRSTHICNLDPAAEELLYEPSIDVRQLISLEDAVSSKGLGPNGGLVFCMEYLMANMHWLHDELQDYSDDFLIIDMPGQVELLSHIPVVPAFVQALRQEGYFVAATFLFDAVTATSDGGKFVSGCVLALTTMMSLDCPMLNLLSKCDLLPAEVKAEGGSLDHFAACDFEFIDCSMLPPRWKALTRQLCTIVDDFSMVRFVPYDMSNEDVVNGICTLLDDLLQVADDADVHDVDVDTDEVHTEHDATDEGAGDARADQS